MSEGTAASAKVWRKLPPLARVALLRDLSGEELETILLDIARGRANAATPAKLLVQWRDDLLVMPSGTDPRELSRQESALWELLPHEFEGLALAPVAPLGLTSTVAGVNQNRIVSTTRGTEVVSDSGPVMALEAARRRRAGRLEVHVASYHRQLRVENLGPEFAPHFAMFTLLSTAPDEGTGEAEASMIARQLAYWEKVVTHFKLVNPTLELAVWDEIVAARIESDVLSAMKNPDLVVVSGEETPGEQYRVGASLIISAEGHGDRVKIGDGGLTGWTAQLTKNKKERCLVSMLFAERLAELLV